MTGDIVDRVARASFACWRKRMDELGHHLDKGRRFEDMGDSELEFAHMNARAMIEAHGAALAAAGFVIVPREPTEAMLSAVHFSADAEFHGASPDYAWRAMIAAAPKDPT